MQRRARGSKAFRSSATQHDSTASPVIVWFRNDLRLADNLALSAACETGKPLICLYVLDNESAGIRPEGGATRWWRAGSLRDLSQRLEARGARLVLRKAAVQRALLDVARDTGADHVFWNRSHNPPEDGVAETALAALRDTGVESSDFNSSLLHEPGTIRTRSGGPVCVFTPFWRAARPDVLPPPRPAPDRINGFDDVSGEALDSWSLEPAKPDWAGGLRATWTRGEHGAQDRLKAFVDDALPAYASSRDRPDRDITSRLSPHLRFGEIGPRQIWRAAVFASDDRHRAPRAADGLDKLLSEIGWREFSYHLLHARPDLARRNIQGRFDRFPWRDDPRALRAWQRGMTGYPLVDAGMRQLWQTGWMHNRVRMVAASFLVKHLLLDWRAGEAWFWDTLVDADPANNPTGWQWVAGSGADAAPYFRIFNPVLQGSTFDPAGDYVRRFVPELARLPPQHIHAPWRAPPLVLAEAGVDLGRTYPLPIVDHAAARQRALETFAALRPR